MKISLIKKAHIVLSCVFTYFSSFTCLCGKDIEVQGHRGSRGTMPENSLPSFEAAVAAGSDVLELDLQISKDGVVFIHHDFFTSPELCIFKDGHPLEEKTLISEWKLQKIKKIDCGSKLNPHFPSQRTVPGTEVPTLQELFDWIQSSSLPNAKSIRLNLELKRDPRHPEYSAAPSEFAKKVVELVRENRFADRVYYSSFDPEILAHVRALDPKATIGFIYNQLALDFMESRFLGQGLEQLLLHVSALRAQIVSPEHHLLKKSKDVAFLKSFGFRVIPWTVNDSNRWEELIDLGVDGLITDYPDELIQYLKKF